MAAGTLVLAAAEAMVSQWSHTIHHSQSYVIRLSASVRLSASAPYTWQTELSGRPAGPTRGRFFGGDILTRGRRIFWHRRQKGRSGRYTWQR